MQQQIPFGDDNQKGKEEKAPRREYVTVAGRVGIRPAMLVGSQGIFRMKRYGMTIHLKPEAEAEYRRYHAAVWPEVLGKISECNIRNYSIFLHDGILFGYFEYFGTDFAADMAKMAADPKTQEWWAIMNPMQQPLANRAEGDWWAAMDEVFHHD